MKIAHLSDLHYCPKHLEEVHRCTMDAVAGAIEEVCDVAVISGDLTDHRIDWHSETASALLQSVRMLADKMPVLILQGTLSHDPPGSVEQFRNLRTRHMIHVSTKPERVTLSGDYWVVGYDEEGDALFSCLPTWTKAKAAALHGAERAAEVTGDAVATLLASWADLNEEARGRGMPTIGVSHGTVNGCLTETGVPMAGLDHEFNPPGLFSASCDAFLLGHIHKHQSWERGPQVIAYPGSIGRLHYGEQGTKGWLCWDVEPGEVSYKLVPTPAVELLRFDFDGPPDMDALAEAAKSHATPGHAKVRVRYSIDEEHRQSVNPDAIRDLFENFKEVKVEPTINPLQRQRAAGIGARPSIEEKVAMYAEHAEIDEVQLGRLLERLVKLETREPNQIVSDLEGGVV